MISTYSIRFNIQKFCIPPKHQFLVRDGVKKKQVCVSAGTELDFS